MTCYSDNSSILKILLKLDFQVYIYKVLTEHKLIPYEDLGSITKIFPYTHAYTPNFEIKSILDSLAFWTYFTE